VAGLVLLLPGVSCGRGTDVDTRRPAAAASSPRVPPLRAPWRVVPGTIQVVADERPEAVRAPAGRVTVGVAFPVTVTSLGTGGCTRPAGAEVAYPDASLAVVTPIDSALDLASAASIRPRPGEPILQCELSLERLRRTIELRFHRPGRATIRVRGRSAVDTTIVVRDTQVVVQPR
jgi:hypothetical protein